jgi:hypothetical protein
MATRKTAPAAPPAEGLVQLLALEPVRADGVDYAPGDALELDAAAAKGLLASGAAELA